MNCLLTPPSDVTQPTADLPAVPAPFDLEHVLLTRCEHIALKCEAQLYKSMHARAVKRIDSLKIQHEHEVCALKTKIASAARRYSEFLEILERFNATVSQTDSESVGETEWQKLRLVIAHNPQRAQEQTQWRKAKIQELHDKGERWAGKLDNQDAGQTHRGRKLS